MDKPSLWIVAGCNGAGKSSFSKALFSGELIPFDYDKYFLDYYQSIQPSDIQDVMAHNLAFESLERQVNEAIVGRKDFCYETNFNSTPLYWPEKFKKEGYEIHLIYFVLDSIDEAKRRVAIRVENGGHYVPDSEIKKRYYEGFANLDSNYSYFDSVDVFDCSAYKKEPRFCFSLSRGELILLNDFPDFLIELIPNISKHISQSPDSSS